MKKYTCQVSAQAYMTTIVEVEAETEEEAIKKAADPELLFDAEWEYDQLMDDPWYTASVICYTGEKLT